MCVAALNAGRRQATRHWHVSEFQLIPVHVCARVCVRVCVLMCVHVRLFLCVLCSTDLFSGSRLHAWPWEQDWVFPVSVMLSLYARSQLFYLQPPTAPVKHGHSHKHTRSTHSMHLLLIITSIGAWFCHEGVESYTFMLTPDMIRHSTAEAAVNGGMWSVKITLCICLKLEIHSSKCRQLCLSFNYPCMIE